jgi:glutathione S-transferase
MNLSDYAGPALVTLATSLLLFGCAAYVGLMRGRHRVHAPAISGHPQFDIAFRIHANTVENAVLFLPALWVCALFFSARWAAALGAVWLAARVWYAFAYAADPKTRSGGFGLSMLAFGALGLSGAWGALRALLAG